MSTTGKKSVGHPKRDRDVFFQQMAALAAEPAGVTAPALRALTGIAGSTLYVVLTDLINDGRIHRMVHGRRDVAYFLTPEAAEAQLAVLLRKYKETKLARRRVENAKRLAKAGQVVKIVAPKTPATRQAARGPAHLPGPAVTTAATIHRVYPTPPWPTRTTTHSVY